MKCSFIRLVLLILALFTQDTRLLAQLPDYHLQLFDHSYGIRPGNILATAKDSNGFLWILYPRQVQRFDGKNVQSFPLPDYLQTICCDASNRVWTTSAKNVYLFRPGQNRFDTVSVPGITADTRIGPVFETPDKATLLFTSRSFYRYNASERTFVPVLRDLPLPPPYGGPFSSYGNAIFFRSKDCLYRYHLQTKDLSALPDEGTFSLSPLTEDSALLTTWRHFSYWYNFAEKTVHPAELPVSLQEAHSRKLAVRKMAQIDSTRYLLAAQEGLLAYNSRTKQFQQLRLYHNGQPVVTNDYVMHLQVGKSGYCWLTTMDGIARFLVSKPVMGLIRLPRHDTIQVNVNNVRQLAEDAGGNIWMGTAYGLAVLKKSGQWQFVEPREDASDRLNFGSIRGLVFDGENLIIGQTDKGIWLFNPKTNQFQRPLYPPGKVGDSVKQRSENDFVNHISTLQNGDHLITARDAMYRLHGKTYRLQQVKVPIRKESFGYSFQSGDGTVWVSTNKGLYGFDSSLKLLQQGSFPVYRKLVNAAYAFDDGLLFASEEGLFEVRLQRNKPVLRKFTSFFDSLYVSNVLLDRKGLVWAATDNGLYRFDPATGKADLLDHTDNLQGYGFHNNSWYRSRSGQVFWGGTNGVNYLQPETFRVTDDPLFVYFREITINSDSTITDLSSVPLLPYSQHAVKVECAAVYFHNPAKVSYRFRLQGYDADWKLLGNNSTILFTSLPPGDYTLQLQASLNGVDWVSAKQSFAFRVNTPFWRQWWFIGLCLSAMITVIWLVIQNRNRKIQEQQEELEAEQAINHFAATMQENTDVETILWDVARNCISRLQFEDCVIYLLDEERNVLVQKAAYGPKSPHNDTIADPIEIPVGRGITGTVAKTGKAEIINDTTRDLRYIVDDQRRFSEISVPILSNGAVLGVIDCEHQKKNFFTSRHLSLLTTIASLCANKIVRSRAETEKANVELNLAKTQQRMSEVEMQALRAQMNPHFIFNCLNSINRYIVKSDQQTASLYLTKFAKLIRLILDNSNSKNVPLSSEMEALKLYIDMEALRFDKKFSYTIDVDEGLTLDSIEVPPLIIQPYVENAIWHGLLHKPTVGHLHIHLSLAGQNLRCLIEDNGVGREKAKELRSKSATSKKSLGMKLTEDRLALLNKQASHNASINIVDLKDEQNEPLGTRVVLIIPL